MSRLVPAVLFNSLHIDNEIIIMACFGLAADRTLLHILLLKLLFLTHDKYYYYYYYYYY